MNGSTRRLLQAGHVTLVALVATVCLLSALSAPALAAVNLYVDQANPNCSNNGSGSASQPFCTIVAAAQEATQGTTVIVSSGTYNGQINPRNSGMASARIVFTAAPGASVTVTGGTRGFYLSGKNYITIQGFNITGTTGDGLYISKATGISLINNRVSNAGRPVSGQTAKGIRLSNTTNSLVSGNTLDHNTDYGLYVVEGSTGNTIEGNRLFANARQFQRAASGIRLHGSSGNVLSSNVAHDNEDSGIEITTASNNNLVVNNVTYGNEDHGIDVLSSVGNRVVSNSVYDNVTAGINAEGGSTSTTIRNNISVDNGINSPRTDGNIRVDAQSTSGSSMDYDLIDLRTSGTLLVWASTRYTSLSSFMSATGQEAHGIKADPAWAAPGAGDFHLSPGSRAIDSADSGAPGQTTADAEGNPRVDDPGTANTGAGPRPYDDRGAYERQPGVTNLPPAAALTVSPSSGTAPLTVTADASASTDTDANPIDSYEFDFGDGTTVGPQAGATATHTYTAGGTFTVTVTVTDTAGLSSTATDQVTVIEGSDDPPAAALTVSPSSGTAPLTVTADASASTDTDANPIDSYEFDFGDGTTVGPQAGATATHTYTAGGTFTVTVTVTDTAGLSSTATDQVTVTENLIGNSGFETDTSGWNTAGSGTGVTLTRVSGGHSGDWAARLANTSASNSTCTLNDSPNRVAITSTGSYTGSIWVRADTSGAVFNLRFREYSGTTLVGTRTTQVTLTTSWQRVTVTYTPVSPGSSSLDFNAYLPASSAPPGTCFYADDAVITLG